MMKQSVSLPIGFFLTISACAAPGGLGSPGAGMSWVTPDGSHAAVEQDWDGIWDLRDFASPAHIAFGEEREFKLPCKTTRVGVAEFGENARIHESLTSFKNKFLGGSDAYSVSAESFSQQVDGGVRFFDLPSPTNKIMIRSIERTSDDDGTRPDNTPMEYNAEIAAVGAVCGTAKS